MTKMISPEGGAKQHPNFRRDILGVPEQFEKNRFVFNSCSLQKFDVGTLGRHFWGCALTSGGHDVAMLDNDK